MDYRALSLQFFYDEKFVTLFGEKEISPQFTLIHQLHRLNSVRSIAECYQMIVKSSEINSERAISKVMPSGLANKSLDFLVGMVDTLKQLLLKY